MFGCTERYIYIHCNKYYWDNYVDILITFNPTIWLNIDRVLIYKNDCHISNISLWMY